MIDILSTLKIDIYAACSANLDKKWRYKNLNDFFSRIYLIKSGEGIIWHHGKKFSLKPNKLFLIPPYSHMDADCPTHMHQYWTHFSLKVLQGINLFDIITPQFEIDLGLTKESILMFEELKKSYKSGDQIKRFKAESILRYFISLFIKDSVINEEKIDSLIRFKKALTYIEENINKRLTLEEIAAVEALHPTYFSNLFKKYIGIPPLKYINLKKVEEAKALLFNSNNSVEQISDLLGIEDVFYFSRLFKKLTGLSPLQYKKRAKKIAS